MLGSPIVELLIGMVFLYSLLSVLVTQSNSVISEFRKIRAHHLRDGFDKLIQDEEIRARVLNHPLINMVKTERPILAKQPLSEEQVGQVLNAGLTGINWVEDRTFVDALMNIIKVPPDHKLYSSLLDIVDVMPDGEDRRRLRRQISKVVDDGEGIELLYKIVQSMEGSTYHQAIVADLQKVEDEISQINADPKSMVALEAGVRHIKNPYFKNTMVAVLESARTIEEAEEKMTKWFNDGMYRVSDAFKSSITRLSLIISFLIVVSVNIDSLSVAGILWNDSALREYVAATAVTSADALQQAEAAAQESITDDEASEDLSGLTTSVENLTATATALSALRLPIGWEWENPNRPGVEDTVIDNADESVQAARTVAPFRNLWYLFNPQADFAYWLYWIAVKMVGLGVTIVAMAQGAPFWFGILKRLSGGSS